MSAVSAESVLFVTLDSCRYDVFEAASDLAMRRVGPLHRAQAPSYFTYGSHSAMFVGFTPGATAAPVPLLNPKFAKPFKLVGGGHPGKGGEGFELAGADIVAGFRARGHRTIGTGAVGWFDPALPTGRHLTASFDRFLFDGALGVAERQAAWLDAELDSATGEARDVFAFLNLGETHVPYWHQGAAWDPADNPCVPFQVEDRAAECRRRQAACLAHIDRVIAPLLDRFRDATILICADHGDAWGEDGVWEHGVAHPAVLTVPLILRMRGVPI